MLFCGIGTSKLKLHKETSTLTTRMKKDNSEKGLLDWSFLHLGSGDSALFSLFSFPGSLAGQGGISSVL